MPNISIKSHTALGLVLASIGATHSTCAGPGRSPVRFELAQDPYPVGPMAGRPVLADMDSDGDLDVVLACGPCCGRDPDPNSGHVQVLLNDGTGKIRPAGDRVRIGETSLGVAVGDINHDGNLDVVAYHHSSYDVAVLIGMGDGQLEPPMNVSLYEGTSPHVHSIVLADVNNDSHLDILSTLVDDHALAVLLGDGTGNFTSALGQPFFAFRHPYGGLQMLDINHDTHLDAVLTDVRGNSVSVLVGSGTGMFSPLDGFKLTRTSPLRDTEHPLSATLGDIDNDGDIDTVLVIDESPLAVRLLNTGDGHFAEPTRSHITLAEAGVGVMLADVTNDGILDLLASTTMTDRCSVNIGNGDGTFGMPIPVRAHGTSPGVTSGDMDGDGMLDIVTGNYDSGTVSVLLNKSHQSR